MEYRPSPEQVRVAMYRATRDAEVFSSRYGLIITPRISNLGKDHTVIVYDAIDRKGHKRTVTNLNLLIPRENINGSKPE